MRTPLPLILAVAAIGVAAPAASNDRPKDVEKFQKAVAGKTAGAPVDCIERRRSSDFSRAGRYVIFRPSPALTYVNELSPGCDTGAIRETLTFRSTSSQLCRGEIAIAVDPLGGAAGGSCTLGEFVPYTSN